MKTLITEHFILRDWCERDIGCAVFPEDTIRYLIEKKNNYAMVLRKNDQVIGTIGLNEDADGNANIRNVGVRILDGYQNQGLMTEALTAVIDASRDIADALSWFCKASDTRSQHLAEKMGFTYVKTFFKEQYGLADDFYYSILNLNSNKL